MQVLKRENVANGLKAQEVLRNAKLVVPISSLEFNSRRLLVPRQSIHISFFSNLLISGSPSYSIQYKMHQLSRCLADGSDLAGKTQPLASFSRLYALQALVQVFLN